MKLEIIKSFEIKKYILFMWWKIFSGNFKYFLKNEIFNWGMSTWCKKTGCIYIYIISLCMPCVYKDISRWALTEGLCSLEAQIKWNWSWHTILSLFGPVVCGTAFSANFFAMLRTVGISDYKIQVFLLIIFASLTIQCILFTVLKYNYVYIFVITKKLI